MGEVFIWHFYNQLVIKKYVWGEAPDEEVLRKAREEEIPQVLDYLERELPPAGFLFGAITVADIALATFFRNAAFARFSSRRAALAGHGRLHCSATGSAQLHQAAAVRSAAAARRRLRITARPCSKPALR